LRQAYFLDTGLCIPCDLEDQAWGTVQIPGREPALYKANKRKFASNVSTCNKIKGIVPLHQSKNVC